MGVDYLKELRALVTTDVQPKLSKLEERSSILSEKCSSLATMVTRNISDIKENLRYIVGMKNDIGTIDGRIEGAKAEVIAAIKLDIAKYKLGEKKK